MNIFTKMYVSKKYVIFTLIPIYIIFIIIKYWPIYAITMEMIVRACRRLRKRSIVSCDTCLANLPVIWISGGPGCGKSTQSRLIAAMYGFRHLSIGNILRDEVNSGSEMGKYLSSFMNRGDLVPFEYITELVKKEMLKQSQTEFQGFLIDSCPRHKENGIMFEKQIAPCKFILYLEASQETMFRRAMKRRLTSGRSDDTNIALRNRLKLYEDTTRDALQYYHEKLENIDAELKIEQVFSQIMAVMKKHDFNIL